MGKVYLCIDLKTFYASVECVERGLDPFKVDLVVADTIRAKNTICLAISPHMKERGIKNRCRMMDIPYYVHPIVAKPRMRKYIEYSARIYGIYLSYVSKDDIHPYSIDEMFLDVTDYLNLYNMTAFDLAKKIMDDIFNTTKITSSCGIGTNLYLAKVALDIKAKHENSHIGYLDEERYKKELWYHLPLTDFWQIGSKTENRLNKLHLKNMHDIASADPKILYKEFGINAEILIDHAKGIEPCTISDIKAYEPKSKSISNSQTLYRDYDFKSARIVLSEMVDSLTITLVSKKLYTNVVGFYIGYTGSNVPLKLSFKLENPTNSYQIILEKVLEEYDFSVNENALIRKINVYFGNLDEKRYEQMNLFSLSSSTDNDRLEKTLLDIKNKFGKNSILRANSFLNCATGRVRNGLIGGHNAE